MALFYQVFAQVYPAQCNRVLVKSHIFKVTAPALPESSLVSVGNFHTLKRFFPTQEQAEKWSSMLFQKFAKGPIKNPILDPSARASGQYIHSLKEPRRSLDGGQLFLF